MIRQEIIDEIKNINEVLNLKYKSLYNISKEKLRSILSTGFGEFKDITPYTDKELEKIKLEGGLTVVDGSVNELGGASPHYIELYQAMSLNSNFDDEIVKSYCFSPLVDENFENKNEKFSIRDKILSKLEVECAIESVATQKPKYVFMDGSLIRFEINCKKEWDELKSSALKHNVILSGVIEDIKGLWWSPCIPPLDATGVVHEYVLTPAYDSPRYQRAGTGLARPISGHAHVGKATVYRTVRAISQSPGSLRRSLLVTFGSRTHRRRLPSCCHRRSIRRLSCCRHRPCCRLTGRSARRRRRR